MNYLNLDRSTLKTAKFVSATLEQQGAWINLLGYCVDQENLGRIVGCRKWDDRAWTITAGIRRKNVIGDSPLWTWDNDDLLVEFYPDRQQKALTAQRSGGKKGSNARWGKPVSGDQPHGVPIGLPVTNPIGVHNTHTETQPDGVGDTVKESKGKESNSNVREEEGTPSQTRGFRVQSRSRPRDIDEAVGVGSMIGLTSDEVVLWFNDCASADWRNHRGEPFQNWPVQLTWHRDRLRERRASTASAGPQKPKIPPGILLRRLEDEAECHPGNPESRGVRSNKVEDRKAFRELQDEIRKLKTDVSGGGGQ